MKHYKGKGRHDISELEEIVEQLLEEKYDRRVDEDKIKIEHDNLAGLVREIHVSCKTAGDYETLKEVDTEVIIKRIKEYIEDFARDNKFRL